MSACELQSTLRVAPPPADGDAPGTSDGLRFVAVADAQLQDTLTTRRSREDTVHRPVKALLIGIGTVAAPLNHDRTR